MITSYKQSRPESTLRCRQTKRSKEKWKPFLTYVPLHYSQLLWIPRCFQSRGSINLHTVSWFLQTSLSGLAKSVVHYQKVRLRRTPQARVPLNPRTGWRTTIQLWRGWWGALMSITTIWVSFYSSLSNFCFAIYCIKCYHCLIWLWCQEMSFRGMHFLHTAHNTVVCLLVLYTCIDRWS